MKRLFILILLLGLAVPGNASSGSYVAGGKDLLLLYSNDVLGEIEPCG